LLSTIDYTFRERRHAPERLLPPQRRLSFQEDAIGTRLRDVIGVDITM